MTQAQGPQAETAQTWYKDAIIYQLHVRAFHDSNADGIGDFQGLTQRLDYIQDLGATAIWLLPFYPSPLKDDGYDIADYFSVHPSYGTLDDFKLFLDQAHARGLRVITCRSREHAARLLATALVLQTYDRVSDEEAATGLWEACHGEAGSGASINDRTEDRKLCVEKVPFVA